MKARPQSGYYVRAQAAPGPEPGTTLTAAAPARSSMTERIDHVMGQVGLSDLVPLGAAAPAPAPLPVERLNRMLARAVRMRPDESHGYDSVSGHEGPRPKACKGFRYRNCIRLNYAVRLTETAGLALPALGAFDALEPARVKRRGLSGRHPGFETPRLA